MIQLTFESLECKDDEEVVIGAMGDRYGWRFSSHICGIISHFFYFFLHWTPATSMWMSLSSFYSCFLVIISGSKQEHSMKHQMIWEGCRLPDQSRDMWGCRTSVSSFIIPNFNSHTAGPLSLFICIKMLLLSLVCNAESRSLLRRTSDASVAKKKSRKPFL